MLLVDTVALVEVAAPGARLRRVRGINEDREAPGPLGLVDDESSWAKAQEWSATRWGLRSRTRLRTPLSSSRDRPRPVRSASVTIVLEMMWFWLAACRASCGHGP